MPLSQSSLAAGVGAAAKNVQFKPDANTKPRKILVIGEWDETTKTDIVEDTLYLVTSPEDVGARFGFGFNLHRLSKWLWKGSQGVEAWMLPVNEDGGGAQAAGSITFTPTAVLAGTVFLYIGGEPVPFSVTAGMTGAQIASAAIDAINADTDLPVTAAVGTPTSLIDLTAKQASAWGDEISIAFNLGYGEELPTGLATVVVDMTGGAGVLDIQNALENGLGTGDNQNLPDFTDVCHSGLDSSVVLNALSTYNGIGNDFLGDYSKTVARPFRSLYGNVATGSAGLTAVLAAAALRTVDRTNGVICVPGSPNHPAEIAAQAVGHMARKNDNIAAEHYVGIPLADVWPGSNADNWTKDYDSRDTAVKGGVGTTMVDGGSVVIQDLISHYRPSSVPVSSNGYRDMVNISKTQNILTAILANFRQEKWKGFFIVTDVTKVSNSIDRTKARDLQAVLNDLVALTIAFEGRGWIYEANYTLERLKAGGLIEVRPGGRGFNLRLPVVYSGVGTVIDSLIEFDTSIAVLL